MSIEAVVNAAKETLAIIDSYSNKPHREMLIDPILFAVLRGRHPGVTRQYPQTWTNSTHPKRIDYRCGGSNPMMIELVVRPPLGGGLLHASQNKSELRKLTRVPPTAARLRVLLLIDLSPFLYQRQYLKPGYDAANSGPGKFKRSNVRVIYVHRDAHFSFLWRPSTHS